jgi:putative Ca2+/H+ antiporter (TMEM165/GDT1 family)
VDALLTTFIAAALAELGDKTQLLVIALAARYRAPGQIIAGMAVAALANSLIAATAGTMISGMITLRAISLLVALALVFAGIAGLIRGKAAEGMGSTWKAGAFLTTAGCFFLLEFGDKTQFLTFALAAQYDGLALAAAGATAGVVAANLPAAALAERAPALLRLVRVRLLVALLFLLAGFVVGLSALRLV